MEPAWLLLYIIASMTSLTTGKSLGTLYTIYPMMMNQTEATAFCEERGDHLPTFKTLIQYNSFLEIKDAWVNQSKLFHAFWVSLMKDPDNVYEVQFWHDGSNNTNNLGFLVEAHSAPTELCYRFILGTDPPPFRDELCTSKMQMICERDLGECVFYKYPDSILYDTVTRNDVGNLSLEECQNQCRDHDVIGEECSGVEMDQAGSCSLLIGTKLYIFTVPTLDSLGDTLYVKGCYGMDENGNPSSPVTFHLYNIQLDWDQTQSFCEYNGQSMVKLNTRAKLDAFAVLFDEWSNEGHILGDVWFGLRDREDSGMGDFIWTDQQPLSTLTRWTSDEPNNPSYEHCVRLTTEQMWRTRECFRSYQVVCESAADECIFKDSFMVPENASVTVSGLTEAECKQECLTKAWSGEECEMYLHDTGTCDIYTNSATVTSTSIAQQKQCFFSDVQLERENIGKRYSFVNLTMNNADTNTFCNLIGEEPLHLNSTAAYNEFLQILQDISDIPVLNTIWMKSGGSSGATFILFSPVCDVIINNGGTYSSTTQSCDVEAQVVCFGTMDDCTYVTHVDSNLAQAEHDILHLSGQGESACEATCDKTRAGDRICVAIVHDGNTDCQLIMRSSIFIGTPPNLVSDPGKKLTYLKCHEAVFLDRPTTALEYSIHGLRLQRGKTEPFCTKTNGHSLLPASLPELTAVFHAISHWGDMGLLPYSPYVWTMLRPNLMDGAYEAMKTIEDTTDTQCAALNHETSTWTPLTCTKLGYVVCQKDQGSCTLEEHSSQTLSDRSRTLVIPNSNLEACKTWCAVLAATYEECVALEFDGADCIVQFADSYNVASTPAMTSSDASTVFVRRCYTLVTPEPLNLLSHNFVMFDSLLTHTESRDACSAEGLEMLKLDNESSPALANIANRTNNIWLGLIPGDSGYTWADGMTLTWVNWLDTTPDSGQCVALDKTSSSLAWIGQECDQTNFAMCNNGTGDCDYISHPGKTMLTVTSETTIVISQSQEEECKVACTHVRVGTSKCRGFSRHNFSCYLDMGETVYLTDPDLKEDESFNTSIRVCHNVEVIPYIPTSTVQPSSVMSETSSLLFWQSTTIQITAGTEEISSSLFEPSTTIQITAGTEEIYSTLLESMQDASTVAEMATSDDYISSTMVPVTMFMESQATDMVTDLTDSLNQEVTNMEESETVTLASQMSADAGVADSAISDGVRYVYQVCLCRCRVQLPDTPVLMSIEIRGIKKELLLNKRNLSSFLRTKMSAPNRKKSAVTMGSGLGISIMVSLMVFFFILDFDNIIMVVKGFKTPKP